MADPTLQLHTVSRREDGCYSVMKWKDQADEDGRPFAVSVERTFEGKRTVIGNGTFKCKRTNYIKGGYPTFEILVEGHSRVLFHKGNKEDDSLACVIVAENFTLMGNQTAIGDSKGGFTEFMQLTAGLTEFDMIVTGR